MTKETNIGEKPTQAKPKAETLKVTSDKTLDFSFGWGIHAGEVRDLPVEEDLQKIILSNHHIKLI